MRKKLDKKAQAIALREKGRSYNEIAKTIHVSKSSLNLWFKNLPWSEELKKRLAARVQIDHTKRLIALTKALKLKWEKLYNQAREEAAHEFDDLKENPLFILGVSLYWGEGDKIFRNGHIRFTNTDPRMLSIFNKFLYTICKVDVEKIRASIIIYPDLNPNDCLKFWSKYVNIQKENFGKPITIVGRHKTKRLNYGICMISVGNKRLKAKLLKWIDLFSENFAGVV